MPTFWWNAKWNRAAGVTEFFFALHEPVIVSELSGGKGCSICMTALGQQFLHPAHSLTTAKINPPHATLTLTPIPARTSLPVQTDQLYERKLRCS
jgi:hypothetical protein